MAEQSQEEMLKQQKANCIFCKIVAGEIPSKKVFEDEKILAILDINPATKGHTLVLTKEHYPIMPLIPPEEFDHLFGLTAALSGAVREGSLAQRCTTFIANGAVAGQQSPHFLFHLIPREERDVLDVLNIPKKGVNQSDLQQILSQNLYAIMRQHLTKSGRLSLLQVGTPAQERPPQAAPAAAQPARQPAAQPQAGFDELAMVLQQNAQLRTMLMNDPDRFKMIIEKDPELRRLFSGIDLRALAAQLRKIAPAAGDPGPEEQDAEVGPHDEPRRAPHEPELKAAKDMTLGELFAFIDSKPRLREYLLRAPGKLKALIPENKALRQFFAGTNVDSIALSYQEHVKALEAAAEEARDPSEREHLVAEERQMRGERAAEMTMPELFEFIDEKPRLRQLIVQNPDKLKALINENPDLKRFFEGANFLAIVQAYQEHAKEKFGVQITMEPDESTPEEKIKERAIPGPTREQEEDAWEEVRWPRANLDKISRLFR